MLDPLIPDAEQQRDIDRIARETSGASLDASTPGAGKTLVALAAAQKRGAEVVLVIAPLGTRLGWKDTATRIGYDLPFRWIRSTKDGPDALTRLQFEEPGIYFIGPEYATQLNWDTLTNKNGVPLRNESGKLIKKRNKFWDEINPDMLIIDEVHEGTANSRSSRHKTYDSSMHARHIHALSGTPHGNTFEGIYPVTKVLWPSQVPPSRPAFIQEYVALKYDPWPTYSGVGDFRNFKRKYCPPATCIDPFCDEDHWHGCEDETHLHGEPDGEKEPGAYFASLPCVVRRMWVYSGEIDDQNVYVELSAAQRKAYDELEEHMATMIEGDPFIIDFPSSLHIRLRQATLGMFRVEEDGSVGFAEDCKSTKLDALYPVLDKDFEGEPALLFTDSKRFAYVATARLNQKYGAGTAEIYSGDQSHTKREQIRERFDNGTTKYLVMIIKAGGTGLDGLQFATRNLAWISRDYSWIKNTQGLARVVRRGQGALVRVRHLIAAGTADAGILSRHIQTAIEMNRTMRLDKQRVSA